MRIGLIGAGNISQTHGRAAAAIAGVSVAAVYGQNKQKAERLAELHGARAYDNLDRFLDHKPMDAVAIGSPSGLHAAHGIEAARRGLHVLVEKPIDITTARADALVAEARAHRVKLGVFFQDRLRPAVRRMKALVDEGTIGKPILASGRVKWWRPPEYYGGSRWRGTWALDGGGALMNQAIHTVDLMLWLLGPVRRVSARTATSFHQIEVEDTAVAVLEFAGGALGTFEAATSAFPGFPRRLEVTGSGGTMVLEDDRLVSIDLREKGSSERDDPPFSAAASATSPVVADASAHQAVIEDFIRAVERDEQPSCNGEEGRRSVEVVEAMYASARRGGPVDVGRA